MKKGIVIMLAALWVGSFVMSVSASTWMGFPVLVTSVGILVYGCILIIDELLSRWSD